MFDVSMLWILLQGIGETLYMTLGSFFFSYVVGLPLGIVLVVCAKDGLHPCAPLYKEMCIRDRGMWGIFQVFIDTIVICTLTALVILSTGAVSSGKDGAALSTAAFESVFGNFG